MLDIILGIILIPLALLSTAFTVAIGVGIIKGIKGRKHKSA